MQPNDTTIVPSLFALYTTTFTKAYSSADEQAARLAAFTGNLQAVATNNADPSSPITMGLNQY